MDEEAKAFMTSLQQDDTQLKDDKDFLPNSEEKETETPSDPSKEKEPKEENPSQGGAKNENTPDVNNLPFNKHPRWIEQQKTLDELKTKLEALEKKPQETKIEEKSSSIPDWFSELYGNSQEAWNKYQQAEEARKVELTQQVLRQIKEEEEQQITYQKALDNWVTESVSALKNYVTENKLPTFSEKELLNVMEKYQPTDDSGNLDFARGYELLKELKSGQVQEQKEKSDARKRIADGTISGTKGERSPRDYKTSEDFRGKTIRQLISE